MSVSVPEFLYHGSIFVFSRPDVRKGRGYRILARALHVGRCPTGDRDTLLRLLKPERLGVQWFVRSQSIVDRLIKRFEIVAWRDCL